jgi:hypothetical protein
VYVAGLQVTRLLKSSIYPMISMALQTTAAVVAVYYPLCCGFSHCCCCGGTGTGRNALEELYLSYDLYGCADKLLLLLLLSPLRCGFSHCCCCCGGWRRAQTRSVGRRERASLGTPPPCTGCDISSVQIQNRKQCTAVPNYSVYRLCCTDESRLFFLGGAVESSSVLLLR